jgi:plasmid maintenance system antidote protein VapI
MKIFHAMKTQEQISKALGFSQPTINLVLTGKRKVSWPMAVRLAELFPAKTVEQWKNATPDQLRRAFSFLEVV